MSRSTTSFAAEFPVTPLTAGEVVLVGAGPGDPGLLTLAGRAALAQADVVLFDRLGCEEILQAIPPHVRLVDVGKIPGAEHGVQERINDLLTQEALAGNRVVRLKGGDPFVFGRGMEEVDHLLDRGIPCRVIPGISSSIAGPAAAGIPVTHRGVARSFSVTTGRDTGGSTPPGGEADTRIYLMGIGALRTIVADLLSRNVSPDMPAALVTNATTWRQQSLVATLGTIADAVERAALQPPGLLVVGPTAAFASTNLQPRRAVVVTSSRVPAWLLDRFPDHQLLWRPLVHFAALEGECRAGAVASIRDAIAADWLVFNSPQAIHHFFPLLMEAGFDSRRLRGRIAVVGDSAAEALREFHLRADLVVAEGTPLGIRRQLEALRGSIVAVPGSDSSRSRLAADIQLAGAAHVMAFPVYTTVLARTASVDWALCDHVFLAGTSAVARFAAAWPDAPVARLNACCLGATVASAARTVGFLSIQNLATAEPVPGDAAEGMYFAS